jgi:hypothetical protein
MSAAMSKARASERSAAAALRLARERAHDPRRARREATVSRRCERGLTLA